MSLRPALTGSSRDAGRGVLALSAAAGVKRCRRREQGQTQGQSTCSWMLLIGITILADIRKHSSVGDLAG